MARLARIIGGFSLIVAGILMLALPGPGILTIIAGLALLAKDMQWAQQLETRVKERFVGPAESAEPGGGPETDPV